MPHFAFPVKIVNQTYLPSGGMIIVGEKNDMVTLRNLNTDQSLDNAFLNNSLITGDFFPNGVTFSEATSAVDAFNGCVNLTGFKNGVTFQNLVHGERMFQGCESLSSLPLSVDLNNLQESESMFQGCSSLSELPEGFTMSSLKHAEAMFSECTSLSGLPSTLTFSSLEKSRYMFQNCKHFHDLPSNLDLASLSDGWDMFKGCSLSAQSVKNLLDSLPEITSPSDVRYIHIGKRQNKDDDTSWENDPDIMEKLNTTTTIQASFYNYTSTKGWKVGVE